MKNSIQDSAIGWLTDAPEDWQPRMIKRDFEVVLGKMLQSEQASADETEEKYLRSANLGWDNADLSDVKTMWFSPKEKARLHLQYGDLLVSEGGDVGRTSFWRDEIAECYYQNAINRIRNRQSDSTRFLYYWLYFLKHVGFVDAVVSRITIPHLTAEKLEGLPYLRPPFAEQRRIAAYLDKACAAIDRAIGAKRQQLEVLDNLRKSIIHKAVTRGLNEQLELKDSCVDWLGKIPRHWEVKPIKQVAGILNGYAFESECYVEEGGVPIIRISDVENEIIWNEVKKVPEELLERLQRFIINKGDILIALTGATIGKSAVFRSDRLALLNQRVSILRTYAINQDFLSFVIKSDSFTEPVDLLCYGGAQDNIGKGEIGSIKIAVPPPQEQAEIASYLTAKSERISSLVLNLEAQTTVLEQYRKSLIHECVTGKRRINKEGITVSSL